jgi:hypothetical protein
MPAKIGMEDGGMEERKMEERKMEEGKRGIKFS